MRQFFLLTILLPVFSFAQPKQKSEINQKKTEGYIINGEIKGFSDGTSVQLINAETATVESEAIIKNNIFVLRGKLESPGFKIILFNKQPPYITLFLDNSIVKIAGTKEAVDKSIITGSKSHTDFGTLSKALEPYKRIFETDAEYDSTANGKALEVLLNFIKTHVDSYVTPLALIRFLELSDDVAETEALYNLLLPLIKHSNIGLYISQIINSEKASRNSTLADFSQTDTSGNVISLSSLRGQYVLVDFWASWCAPCRKENPNIVAAYNKYKAKNFTVLGVSLDKARQAWVDAINMDGLVWTHVSDLKGWANAAAQQFQIYSIPQNYLLDPEGRIIGKNLRGASLERKLARVLE